MSNDLQWALALIGKPWIAGARGPDAFDCWGLVVFAYQYKFGIILDAYEGVDATAVAPVVSSFIEEQTKWEEVAIPTDFCLVAMGRGKAIHHVGVWIADDRTVLHSMDKTSVVAHSLTSLKTIGINTIKFYIRK